MKLRNNQSGFTLIELVMIIVILGILAAVAIPKYQDLSSEAKEAAALSDAQTLETAMKDVVCTISANAGEEGKLYGSVSTADIAENLLEQGFEVEKRDINMPEAIRNTGEYEITVSLYAEVVVPVKVVVIAATETE